MMRRLAEFGPYMPMANRLILDTDGGVDDAQAVLLLIAAGRAPDAITTVYGNVSLQAATDNVLAILAAAGAHIEVHAGAAQPLHVGGGLRSDDLSRAGRRAVQGPV